MTDYKTLMRKIVKHIRIYRNKKNLTQVELARKIGKSDKYINGIESGIESISLPALVDIANALDTSVEYLISGADSDNLTSRINALEDEDQKTIKHLISRLED